jgi:hypothetical protein
MLLQCSGQYQRSSWPPMARSCTPTLGQPGSHRWYARALQWRVGPTRCAGLCTSRTALLPRRCRMTPQQRRTVQAHLTALYCPATTRPTVERSTSCAGDGGRSTGEQVDQGGRHSPLPAQGGRWGPEAMKQIAVVCGGGTRRLTVVGGLPASEAAGRSLRLSAAAERGGRGASQRCAAWGFCLSPLRHPSPRQSGRRGGSRWQVD